MKIRLYQINPDKDVNRLSYLSIMEQKPITGNLFTIDNSYYDCVFDGDVDAQNKEDVFRIFNANFPDGYKGRSMSVSDVLEVIDENGKSEFYYTEAIGFFHILSFRDMGGYYKE